jgi:DNA-binding response OmpR family regulator
MQPSPGVLVVSAFADDHARLRDILEACGWTVHSASSPGEADFRAASVVLTDFDFWLDVVESTARLAEPPPVIVMTHRADAQLWSDALIMGVYDLLLKPLDAGEVLGALAFARPAPAILGVVMVVDAPEVQSFAAAVLRREGYHVLTPAATSAPRLLELVDVTLVVTNQPEMVSAVRPDARILYTAAVPDRSLVDRLPNPSIGILEKPYRAADLLAEVARLLRKPVGSEPSRQRPPLFNRNQH